MKMWKFSSRRDETEQHSLRIDTCGRSRSAYPYPISIRVWGIVSFIAIGSYHNLHLDKRKSAPHFLCIILSLEHEDFMSIWDSALQ